MSQSKFYWKKDLCKKARTTTTTMPTAVMTTVTTTMSTITTTMTTTMTTTSISKKKRRNISNAANSSVRGTSASGSSASGSSASELSATGSSVSVSSGSGSLASGPSASGSSASGSLASGSSASGSLASGSSVSVLSASGSLASGSSASGSSASVSSASNSLANGSLASGSLASGSLASGSSASGSSATGSSVSVSSASGPLVSGSLASWSSASGSSASGSLASGSSASELSATGSSVSVLSASGSSVSVLSASGSSASGSSASGSSASVSSASGSSANGSSAICSSASCSFASNSLASGSSASGSLASIANSGANARTVDTISVLLCPVCLRCIPPPILQCLNGHIVCSNCRLKLPYCAFCRGPLGSIRKMTLEKISSDMILSCTNSNNDCTVTIKPTEKAEQEEAVEIGPYKCPWPGLLCQWQGSLEQVVPHLSTSHKCAAIFEDQSTVDIVFLLADINAAGVFNWMTIHSCFGHHFILVLEKLKLDGHIQYFALVELIGSRKEAEKFSYRLELKGKDRRRLTWEAATRSIHDGSASAFFNFNCLAFDTSVAKLFINDSKLTITVTISAV